MRRKIHLSALAESDPIAIWQYSFERWDADQADRYLEELDHGIGLLADNAELGAKRDEVREGYRVVQRAGHGVGKSTFSLMLRAVLGDDGAAVKTMRNHLAEHYGSGGIAAEVYVGAERFAVFRSFGSHSFALRAANVEQLFEEGAKSQAIDFSTYVATLGDQACLQHMSTRALPVTGQPVEWEHVLCWLARDQALGLRQYFEWRNDDGAGLRRKAKDPPALTRLVLGLLSDAEAKAESTIASISNKLSTARDVLRVEGQRGSNTRAIVETQLRTWAGVSNSLQMVTDDLFADSVEREIQRKTQQIDVKNDEDRAALETSRWRTH